MMPTPPDTEGSSNASPDGSFNNESRKRAASPTPSSTTLSSMDVDAAAPSSSTVTATQTSAAPASTSAVPPAKRRKLSPAEKLEQAQLKEAKAREKAEKLALKEQKKAEADAEKAKKEEEKARKAEEKRVKDEEKRQKAEEKEAAKREKEIEVERKLQEKEAAKREKEEAKLKKERSQMRLGAFFQKPATPAKATLEGEENQPRARRKSLSLEPFDAVADQIKSTASPAKGTPPPSTKKPAMSDYQRTFLPFELPAHGSLARVIPPSDADVERFDYELNDPAVREKYDLGLVASYISLEGYFGKPARRGRGHPNIRKMIDQIHGTSVQPVDLTREDEESPLEVLRRVPTRHIHFEEDVRPAYCGTYTKIRSPTIIRKTMRNPYTQSRPDTDYNYDSEAEWEPPDEGDEEVLSDEEDEAESNADEGELEDFLDDEDDKGKEKRKMLSGDLLPESTGLCWANEKGRLSCVEGNEVAKKPDAMSGMRMGFLIPGFSGSTIDPFSTDYWETNAAVPAPAVPATGALGAPTQVSIEPNTLMPPPRQPLQPKLNFNGKTSPHDLVGAAEGQKGPITSTAAMQTAKRGRKPTPRTLSQEDLDGFKEAIVGSPLGRQDLQKGLKTR